MIWILKQVQWQYLVFAILIIFLLIWREKTFKAKSVIRDIKLPGLNTQITFLFSLVLIFLILRNWFTLPEVIALNIALLPAVFLVGIDIIRAFASLRYKWIYAFTLLLPLFLMSQTFPQTQIDTTKTKTYNTYHSIGGGFATGNYTDDRHTRIGEGCGAVHNHQYFNHKYNAGGAGYSLTKETPDRKEVIRYGVNVFLGDYNQIR